MTTVTQLVSDSTGGTETIQETWGRTILSSQDLSLTGFTTSSLVESSASSTTVIPIVIGPSGIAEIPVPSRPSPTTPSMQSTNSPGVTQTPMSSMDGDDDQSHKSSDDRKSNDHKSNQSNTDTSKGSKHTGTDSEDTRSDSVKTSGATDHTSDKAPTPTSGDSRSDTPKPTPSPTTAPIPMPTPTDSCTDPTTAPQCSSFTEYIYDVVAKTTSTTSTGSCYTVTDCSVTATTYTQKATVTADPNQYFIYPKHAGNVEEAKKGTSLIQDQMPNPKALNIIGGEDPGDVMFWFTQLNYSGLYQLKQHSEIVSGLPKSSV